MPCPRCQHENPSGQKFCGECGARLAAPCSACGASNSPDQKFCGACGTSLARGAEAPRPCPCDHPFSTAIACAALAHLTGIRGDWPQTVRLAERAVGLSRDWNLALIAPRAMATLGHAIAWSGRVGDGVAWLQQGLAAYSSVGVGQWLSLSVTQLGEAHLLAGQAEEARACADRAVALARQRGERGHEAWALRLLGDIASHPQGIDPPSAEAHYGAAMTLAAELAMRPLVAHCHLGLGKLYRRTGDGAKAEEHLTTATTMYREMGMTFWLDKADAAWGGVER
jgi:tetratricopeptide (TPR) repeat protein